MRVEGRGRKGKFIWNSYFATFFSSSYARNEISVFHPIRFSENKQQEWLKKKIWVKFVAVVVVSIFASPTPDPAESISLLSILLWAWVPHTMIRFYQ